MSLVPRVDASGSQLTGGGMVPFPKISNMIECIKGFEYIHAIVLYIQVIGISVICIWSGFSRLKNRALPVIG